MTSLNDYRISAATLDMNEKEDGSPLLCPINSKNNKSGYESLAINLLEFKKIESVPINISLDRLDEGQGIAETLLLHKAVYHKGCYLKFANNKLKRAQKRAAVQSSPKKTRKSFDASTQELNCFFLWLDGRADVQSKY